MATSRPGWYGRRLARMSPVELAWRARDQLLQVAWSPRQVRREQIIADAPVPGGEHRFSAVLPLATAGRVPEEARAAVLESANLLLRGEWEVLGVVRTDLVRPDWFVDPVSGRRVDPDRYAFCLKHHPEEIGNAKQVREISRLQHLTLLANAWFVTHEERYAVRVSDHLHSWWRENPFLSGIHWTSGIELGIRLVSLAWIRRLLDDWPGISELFECDELALRQLRWHQQYLAAFPSRGSSASSHAIAEAAGQFVASCAFPWFPESERWRRRSARLLERELIRSTFPSGIARALASDYQCFIAELGFVAAVEAEAAGHPLSPMAWERLCAMADSAAALVDERLRPPRRGNSGGGRGLLLDAPAPNRWPWLLALADVLIGRLDWWPRPPADARSSIVGALVPAKLHIEGRPAQRPSRFADAGITLLRTTGENEIWCCCGGDPRGYLDIAAHAHADALSIEVRYAGVDILADPGGYCLPEEPAWFSYFRSTIAHNTVEVAGRSQSSEGGPFMWVRRARALELEVIDEGDFARWTAEHDGYAWLNPPALHRRSVLLDRASRSIDIIDEIKGASHDIRLAFHLGPEVQVQLDNSCAVLDWPTASTPGAARLELPPALRWTLHRGETEPILGWYAPGPGRRVAAFSLLGSGRSVPGVPLATRLQFLDVGTSMRATRQSPLNIPRQSPRNIQVFDRPPEPSSAPQDAPPTGLPLDNQDALGAGMRITRAGREVNRIHRSGQGGKFSDPGQNQKARRVRSGEPVVADPTPITSVAGTF